MSGVECVARGVARASSILGLLGLAGCGLLLDARDHTDAARGSADAAWASVDASPMPDGGPVLDAGAALDAGSDGGTNLTADTGAPDAPRGADAGPGDVGVADSSSLDAFSLPDACPDSDGDGFTLCMADCDDDDPTRFPGAPLVCGDGVVNDCDAAVGMTPDEAICGVDGLFVSAITGDDTSGTGAPDRPYATIHRGIAAAIALGAPQTVHIGQGTYDSTRASDGMALTVTNGISLRGGYDERSWVNDPSVSVTTITASVPEGIAIMSSVGSGTRLEGLVISQERNAPVITTGMRIAGAPQIVNCAVLVHASAPTVVGIDVSGTTFMGPRLEDVRIAVGGATGTTAGTGMIGLKQSGVAANIQGLDVTLDAATAASTFGVDASGAITHILIDVTVSQSAAATLSNVTGIRVSGGGTRVERAQVMLGAVAEAAVGLVLADLALGSQVLNSVLVAGSGGNRQTGMAVRFERAPSSVPEIVVHSNVIDGGDARPTGSVVGLELAGPSGGGSSIRFGRFRDNIIRTGMGSTGANIRVLIGTAPVAVDHNALFLPAAVGTRVHYSVLGVTTVPDATSLVGTSCGVPSAPGDYHLPATSACVDAGTLLDAPGDDFDLEPRDDAPDIGADEFHP